MLLNADNDNIYGLYIDMMWVLIDLYKIVMINKRW